VMARAGARKAGIPAALVVCDLDHFKRVNDTYGHDTGDRVIEAFAGILREVAPARAITSRWGGEEFVALLPGANLAGARLFAESVRSAFAALPIAGVPDRVRFTASLGVAEARAQEGLSDLRRRADAALYEAKKGGRNRVCLSGHGIGDAMPEHPLAVASKTKMPARSP
jgi:diguanylate cyclase (GGDEF)-like protein